MTLPLSKTLDPADFTLLPKELAIVDRHFDSASPQHPMRRWEYALALDVLCRWPSAQRHLVDVGGAGSPFASIVGELGWHPDLIDPAVPGGHTLAEEVTLRHPRLADVVTCISVLEHVEDLDQFCYHLGCLVRPGGLLFLTMDYCDGYALAAEHFRVPDTYHFHWMRQRIFNLFTVKQLIAGFCRQSFDLFGGVDYIWRGPHVYNYTFASLALVKRAC